MQLAAETAFVWKHRQSLIQSPGLFLDSERQRWANGCHCREQSRALRPGSLLDGSLSIQSEGCPGPGSVDFGPQSKRVAIIPVSRIQGTADTVPVPHWQT